MNNSRRPANVPRSSVGPIIVGVVVAVVVGVVAGARPVSAAAGDPGSSLLTTSDLYGPPHRALGLTVSLGLRSDLVRNSALDAFSRTDGIPQSALSISRRFGGSDVSGLVVGFEWDHGKTNATARGADSSLTIDRLSVAVEGRMPILHRLAGFARIAPGLLHENASIADVSAPGDAYAGVAAGGLHAKGWVPAADISGGLDLRVGELYRFGTPLFGFWLTAEGGYGYAGAHDLVLTPNVATQPGRTDEPLRLGELSLRGPFLRFQFAVSF